MLDKHDLIAETRSVFVSLTHSYSSLPHSLLTYLSVSLCLCIFPCHSVSLCLILYLYVSLLLCLCAFVALSVCVCLSLALAVSISLHLSVLLSISFCLCMSVCLPASLYKIKTLKDIEYLVVGLKKTGNTKMVILSSLAVFCWPTLLKYDVLIRQEREISRIAFL